LQELEKINMLLTQAKEDKEQTLRQTKSKETIIEEYERQRNKLSRLIQSVHHILKDAVEVSQERSKAVDIS